MQGFLSSEDDNLSGNNGLFDMALATDWVRHYIEYFGGNPNKITAMGQGTGASSAFLLGLSRYGQSKHLSMIPDRASLNSNDRLTLYYLSLGRLLQRYHCNVRLARFSFRRGERTADDDPIHRHWQQLSRQSNRRNGTLSARIASLEDHRTGHQARGYGRSDEKLCYRFVDASGHWSCRRGKGRSTVFKWQKLVFSPFYD